MIAYLINPFKREVSEVLFTGDYKHIYKLIECGCFDVCQINDERDSVFIDDNGHYADKKALFNILGRNLVNKGLVLGCDEEGDSVAPTCTLEWLRDVVSFPDAAIFKGGQVASLNEDLTTKEVLHQSPDFIVVGDKDNG